MTVKDEKKVWEYYTKSRVFVSPSVYEGFGMPTIEALALGLPVVISNIKVFHEVGQDLATYFDPHDPKDIAAKLTAALSDPTPPKSAPISTNSPGPISIKSLSRTCKNFRRKNLTKYYNVLAYSQLLTKENA